MTLPSNWTYRTTAIPLLMLAIVSMLQSSHAQTLSDEQARELAKQAVRTNQRLDASAYLNPHRIEDLEEAALSFTPGRAEKPLYFFEVSQEGTESRAGQVIVHASDGLLVQYVAVARSNGQVYCLYGMPDAQNEFNRMTLDQHFHIGTEADAKLFALFYVNSIFGPGSKALIYSSQDLKHMVENHFYGYSTEYPNPTRSFRKWWDGFEKRYESRTFGLRAAKNQQGLRVEFDKIDLHAGEPPKVQTLSLQITSVGQCTLLPMKLLYPI